MSTYTPAVDDLVDYQHPAWGPCTARVLSTTVITLDAPGHELPVPCVLCQDLHPAGGREWWPLQDLVLVDDSPSPTTGAAT